jgi:hypothetical protein
MSTLRPNETRELQQVRFATAPLDLTAFIFWYLPRRGCSAEGYKCFFNPRTGEFLWELPARLKVALHDEDEESLRLIDETPREMLHDDSESAAPDRHAHAQQPIRVV